MLDIRAIVELKKPALIGPTTSINGVFLGPFYYYFNLIPYLISDGDPSALTYWNIAWYMIAALGLFIFFYKLNKTFSLFTSAIFLMTPAFFYSSRYFWSANPMPYVSVFYFLSLFSFLIQPNIINSFLTGFISGLSMQFEAAFGVIFLPFFLVFASFKKAKVKYLLTAIASFSFTLTAQILFELRHQFIMTKTFYREVFGSSQILGEKLALPEIFTSHFNTYVEFASGQLEIPGFLSVFLLVVSVSFLSIRLYLKKLDPVSRNIFLVSILFVVFSFIFYMFYPHPLKGWYLLGLRVPYIFLIALFLAEAFKQNFVLKLLVIILLMFSFINTYFDQSRFIPKNIDSRSADKSNLRNEIEAIDWVYAKASGEGFKAYNYIPSVYDFPYQYLYWWYGGKKYGYHPETVTYLDNVPEYIKDNEKFLNLKRGSKDSKIFLIYEPDENQKRLDAWLGNFTHLCSLEKNTYPWVTTVELRTICN